MNSLKGLLEKEMDRREFIVTIALLLITITGIAGITKSFQTMFNPHEESVFGSKPYGK